MKIYFNELKKDILSVKVDKRLDLYNWGLDNSYPSLIEQLINNSVTAKACVNSVAKAIYVKSFGDAGKIIINKEGQTLNEVLRIISYEYAKYNNVYIHIGYNGDLKINSIKVIPATDVRLSKSDDKGYSGKFIVYPNFDKVDGKVNEEDFKYVDRFNPLKEVIENQIENAGGILKYKGQIIHLKKDANSVYSLPDLNPVLAEALLESNSQTFRSKGASKGFLNTKLMVVQPFSNDDDRKAFKRKLDELQGAENAGAVVLLESSNMSDNLDGQLKLDDLSSEYNDELFKYSDLMAEKNITKAFGVPLVLIDTTNDGLFGNSGEMIKLAKELLIDSREEERDLIEETLQKLMMNYHQPITKDLKILK